MKAVALLIGLGLLLLVGTVGCEEEHEHHHHGGQGGAYDGTYHGYGNGPYPYDGDYGYPHHY